MADPIPSPGPATKVDKSRPKYGGRKAGTPNKVTRDIREAAGKYGPEALETFVEVMRNGENEATRLVAADKIMNRAYGTPKESKDININVAFGEALERAARRLVGRDAS